jgi:ribosomal protein L40E
MPNAILCDHCEALNPLDCRNCQQCGRDLFRVCRNCGDPVAKYYTRCPHCGRSTGRGVADGGQDLVGRPEHDAGFFGKLIRKLRRLAGGGS